MNGITWSVIFVDADSSYLIDRTGNYRVATTDPITHCVYLSNDLSGDFLIRVLIHELGHCALVSFNLSDDICHMVKHEYLLEAEEWTCNFIADYGLVIFEQLSGILGEQAIRYIPNEIERLLA